MSDVEGLEQLRDFKFFAPNFFKIKRKNGAITPLVMNRTQEYVNRRLDDQLAALGMVRAVVLKGRQQGLSTLIEGRYTHKVITRKGTKAYILTHEKEATSNIFEMAHRFIENLPPGLCPKPDTSAANKLYFKNFDSGFAVGTAGNKATGRSQTIQLFHGSEVAYWPFAEEHAKGVMQAISREEGTEIILESTANGIGNYFYDMWQTALSDKSEYQAIFAPWYWQDEYSVNMPGFITTEEEVELLDLFAKDGLVKEHLAWRRLKIAEFSNDYERGLERFKQEYPFTSVEAFRNSVENAFINAACVLRARKASIETDANLVIGVDPALGDKDQTAIIRRRGRKAYQLETYNNHNTMETAGRLRKIIDVERPGKVYVDVIGIGSGIVDRLQELGYHQVEAVDVRNRASERNKFKNKRAELWEEMRLWLTQDLPVQIPDSDQLHGHLTCLGSRWNSNGQLVIEDKDELAARGLPSPDTADALAYTFAGGFFDTKQEIVNIPAQRRDVSGMFF